MQKRLKKLLENIYNKYEKNVRSNNTYSSSFKNLINAYDWVKSIFKKPSAPSA